MAQYRVNFIKGYNSDGRTVTVTVIKDSAEHQFKVTSIAGQDIGRITSNFSSTFRQYLTKGAVEGDVTYWATKPEMVTEPANALAALKIPMVAEEDITEILNKILEKLKGYTVDKNTIINYINNNNITNITDIKIEGNTVIINGNPSPITVSPKTTREAWKWSDFCAKPTEEEKKEYYRTHFPKRKSLSGATLVWAMQHYHEDAANFALLVKFMQDGSIVLESLEEALEEEYSELQFVDAGYFDNK